MKTMHNENRVIMHSKVSINYYLNSVKELHLFTREIIPIHTYSVFIFIQAAEIGANVNEHIHTDIYVFTLPHTHTLAPHVPSSQNISMTTVIRKDSRAYRDSSE